MHTVGSDKPLWTTPQLFTQLDDRRCVVALYSIYCTYFSIFSLKIVALKKT